MKGLKQVLLSLCCCALLITATLYLLGPFGPLAEEAGLAALSPAELQQQITLQQQRVQERQAELSDQLVAFYLGYGSEEATRALIDAVEQEKAQLAALEAALGQVNAAATP